jgi:glycerol kinase
MAILLAVDQGTTSSRAILFDGEGNALGVAQRAFAQHFPQPGWVEHDAREIWQTQRDCIAEVLQKTGLAAADVNAVGITNQRETTVLWDRHSGAPLAPAIVWQDRRTAALCDRLRAEGRADDIRQRTGLEIDAYFSASKLAWLLEHVPNARQRAAAGELAFGTVDSWLIWNLTGGACHVTDASNASRTMLFNLHRGDWDDTLLELFAIPRPLLPRLVDSSGILGHCDARLFGAPMPLAGIAGDQQAATFGQACLQPGMAKNTYGTGCFVVVNTGDKPPTSTNRLLGTVGWRRGGQTTYLLEGSVFVGGALIQWLRDGLGILKSAAESELLAASVPDSGGVVLVPAFTGLGAPHWDAYARGTLLGLTRGTTAAHIARAALEAIALQCADLIDAMRADGATLAELRVDGGASANNLLMQLQADLLGVPVVRPRQIETTAFGAACLAGLGVGVWRDAGELAAHWHQDRRFEPQAGNAWRDEMKARWQRGLQRAKGWEQPDAR